MVWRRLSERHYFPQQPAPEPIDALGSGRVTSRLAVVLNEFASAASDQSALALSSVFNSQQIISARLIYLLDFYLQLRRLSITGFEQAGRECQRSRASVFALRRR
jgi:hypothetical protein